MPISETITEGVGEYAVIKSKIGLIIASIIAIVLIFISIRIFRSEKIYTEEVKATIKTVNCVQHNDKNKITFSCNMDVEYKVGEQTFTKNITKNEKNKYIVGELVPVYVEKSNPSNSSSDKDTNKWAYILLFSAIVLIGLTYMLYYFTSKYKGFATISGGVQAIGDVSSIFRSK
jgi:hypothetical protein